MLSLFLLTLLPLSLAHFNLVSPPARGFDEDKLGEYPCGSQNTLSSTRTPFPLAGGPIQLDMGHDHAIVQVNLALGNEATDGAAFSTRLEGLVQQEGLGNFCLGDVVIPSNLNIKEGDNATLQVITNGDPSGGLYNCADITFTASAQPGSCNNGTGVKAEAYTGNLKNANGTDSSATTTGTTTGSPSPSATKSGNAAAMLGLNGAMLTVVLGAALFMYL